MIEFSTRMFICTSSPNYTLIPSVPVISGEGD